MSNLNLAILSDLHLGHSKNTAVEIIKNLKAAFPDNSETSDLDIIFIAGDVFDTLLNLSDDDVYEIDAWIAYMLNLCAKHNITLRILDGTKSHDWYQSERFISILKIICASGHGLPVDAKYIKELTIEYIEKYDINVLYVPDEINSTTEKTLEQVKELLIAKGLTQVDYAILHGAFSFQFPEYVKCQKHDQDAYLSLVKELIFIGHIHTYNKYDRIIAQGSFDRLCMGEEGPKGHVRVKVVDGKHNIVFVENKNAKIFKSIDCIDLTLEETINKVDLEVKDLPPASYVRVISNKDNPIFSNMNVLIKRHPLFVWSKLSKDVEEEEELVEENTDSEYVPITITNQNIKGLIMERITNVNISPDVLVVAEKLLEEVL